jgi:prolyl oligopeptidase
MRVWSVPGRRFPVSASTAFLLGLCWLAIVADAAPPRAPKKPLTTNYHGVSVSDDYAWLENAADPAVRKWTDAQNNAARAYLERLPSRAAVSEEGRRLLTAEPSEYTDVRVRGGKIFALKAKPSVPQAALILRGSATNAAGARVLVDPGERGTNAEAGAAIDFYEPSWDGQWVAVSLSPRPSGSGTLHVYEVATRRELPDRLERAQVAPAGGAVVWNADGSGFFYTRYPAPGENSATNPPFRAQVYFHRLGTPQSADRYEIGSEFPRLGAVRLQAGSDGRYVLASVTDGAGGARAHWLRPPSGPWRRLAGFEDQVDRVEFGHDPIYIEWPSDDGLYLLSRKDAPRGRILRLRLADPDLAHAREVVSEGLHAIGRFVPTASGLYFEEIDGGPSILRFRDFYAKGVEAGDTHAAAAPATNGTAQAHAQGEPTDPDEDDPDLDDPDPKTENNGAKTDAEASATESAHPDAAAPAENERRRNGRRPAREEWALPLRGVVSVPEMVCLAGDQLLFRTEGFFSPPKWSIYEPRDRDRTHSTALGTPSPASFVDVEVVREFVVTKDGTKVPLTILRPRGLRLTGQAPTLLTGVGGFGISLCPEFEVMRRIWLDQGGVIAVANVRGGGEYGEAWHVAGSLTNRQNAIDDFIACAEFLVRSNYTHPGRLALLGEGPGALVAAEASTQRPELFRAVALRDGVFDLLRAETDAWGQFAVTEMGSVERPEQFRVLHALSPYHRVAGGAVYPAMLLWTGDEDAGPNPAHSRKLAARLQAAGGAKGPALLRTRLRSGQGAGVTLEERLDQWEDLYAFLFEQLGVEYSEVFRGPWSGSVTPGEALVKAKMARSGLSVRLALSTQPLLTRPTYTPFVRSESALHNLVSFPLDHLKPDTDYYYALEVNGRLDRTKRGQFRTFPAGAASFTFAYASCARTASTSSVFDSIREDHPLFFMNVGDFHYEDIAVADPARFRAAYDFVLSSPQQADLYRSTPFVYVWDDHDYGGNNANRRAKSHTAARIAYDEYVPHYPLGCGTNAGPICQTFNVGRVKFILTDLRSERDPITNRDDAEKTMMGTWQKEWFKNELLQANGKYPLICWVSSVPWIGTKGSNYYRVGTNVYGYLNHTNLTNSPSSRSRLRPGGRPPGSEEDHWSAYTTERREIADFIKSNHIQGVCILHGDSHMLAADDGRYSDYATGGGAPLPVMCAAPLDQEPSLKGGPYSQGVYRVNYRNREGAFGLVRVTDRGDRIQVHFSGRNRWNEEKITLDFAVPATAPPPVPVPAK